MKQLQYQGQPIFYSLTGSGPVVVLLHGFGEDATVWDFQKVYLQHYFQLLIPHLPGSGPSAPIADMSMEGLAQSIYFILEQEAITQCVMIGHSMGGYITLAFAQQYASVLKGFGLFHSTAYADSDEKKATRKKGIQFIKEHGGYNFLKTATPNLYSTATKEQQPALIEKHLQTLGNSNDAALVAYYQFMMARPGRTNVLTDTSLPVLFVLGRWDTAVPLADGLALCHLPNLSYIHILNGSGHMGMVEEQHLSNTILHQYLSATL